MIEGVRAARGFHTGTTMVSAMRDTAQRSHVWLLALILWMWIAAHAEAQTQEGFCYSNGATNTCRDTLDKAEQAMRAAPENASVAQLLEQKPSNIVLGQHSAQYIFEVRDQPGVLYSPSYVTGIADGNLISGGHGCTPGSDPNRASWCADEADLVDKAVAKYRALYSSCTFSAAVPVSERISPYEKVEGLNTAINTHGVVRYGDRRYRTRRTCGTTVEDWHFRIQMEATFICSPGYTRRSDAIANDGNGDLTFPFLCGYNGGVRTITGPIQQVASCKASPNPCYPATGDKARVEPDFVFGGRMFARHYHSLRQFLNNPGLAVGWTHTFSDRVHAIHGASPAAVIDDTGYYESFVAIGSNRYRGENSTDKRLESFASGTVRWRLRLADGEIREFNASGWLIAVRDMDDPRRDVVLTYANGLLVTATDAQGRSLRFEYDGAKRMTRILLPDGRAVRYGYDAENRLTTAEYGDGRIRQYHYAESGLIGDGSQRHHLTGITSETGTRYASFRYDARGRVIESRVFGAPDEVTTVSYVSDTEAAVISASGEQRVYTIQPGLYRRVTAVRTIGETVPDQQQFAADGRLQRRTDRLGVHTDYEYHATDAYLSAIVEAAGRPEQRRQEFDRDPVSHRVTEQRTRNAAGALQSRLQWTYNPRGQVVSATAIDPSTAETRTTTLTYCEQADVDAGLCPQVGLPTSINGPRTDVADVATFLYRVADHPDCASTPASCAWRRGDLWKTTNALGQTVEVLARDGAGRVLSMRDANGVVTDFDYDPRGRPTATKVRGTDAGSESDDRISRIEYWPDGAVKKMVQPEGAFLLFDYDDARRLTTIIDNDGNAIVYTLNAAGDRVKEEVEDASGALWRTLARSYDTLGRLRTIRDAQAQVAGAPATLSYRYDAEGRPEASTDALGRETTYGLDALNRVLATVQNATAPTTASDRATIGSVYDALDHPTSVTDPNGLVTAYERNAFGDLLRLQSPDTGVSTATYDSAGNLRQSVDADGRQRLHSYDALNRVTAVSYPQDTMLNETYLFDSAHADCPVDEAFLVGRLARMTDGSGSTTYCYNRFGDLVRKVQRTLGKTFVLRWQYAANGRLQSMTYPDGSVIDYLHDAQGRIVEIGVRVHGSLPRNPEGGWLRQRMVHGVLYHPFGGPAQWTTGNGRRLVRTLNLSGQPGVVQAQNADGAPIDGLSLGYEFDAAGNLVKLRDGNQAEPPQRLYGYDGLNRLTEARDASNVIWQSYGYDRTGNRMHAGKREVVAQQDCTGAAPGEPCTPLPPTTQWSTQSYGYGAGTHRLGTTTGRDRSHDNAGNLVLDAPAGVEVIDPPPGGGGGETESAAYAGTLQPMEGESASAGPDTESGPAPPGAVTRTYSYSAANRMSGTALGGEHLMSYRYNGAGERVYRTGSGKTVHTLYDGSGRWIGDYDVNGTVIQQAIWLGDLPVGLLARDSGDITRLYTIEPDALGTPRVVVDPARGTHGTVVWRWDLSGEAFGDEKPNEDPDGDGIAFVLDLRFPGQQYDSASGLNYNYFRDYDPTIGRYVQSDPIGLAGGISTYGYVGGNPMIGIDPLGLAQPAPSIPPVAQPAPSLPKAPLITPVAPPGAGAANSARTLPWIVQACMANPVVCAVVGAMIPKEIADHPCEHMNGPPCGGPPEPTIDPCKPPKPDVNPGDLCEMLALMEAKAGAGLPIMGQMADEPRLVAHYGPGPWMKMEHKRRCFDGRLLVIHYFTNGRGLNVELKFKRNW